VLKDCAGCPKREQCDETALVHDVAINGTGAGNGG
jgi:hypothetical protein